MNSMPGTENTVIEPSCNTAPFAFAGSDIRGQRVKGSIVALDAADAFAQLLRRGIAAQSVAAAANPEPYQVVFEERRDTSLLGSLLNRLKSQPRF